MLRPTSSPTAKQSTLRALALGLSASLSFVAACPTPEDSTSEGEGEGEGREGEGEGEGEGEVPGDGDCPVVEGGNSVCDVQDSASENAVGTGSNVVLPGVVATTPPIGSSFVDGAATRYTVYVSDTPNAKRGGVAITWKPADVTVPLDIVAGDVLNVEGTVSEFTLADQAAGTETRIDVTVVTKAGGNTPVAPLSINASDLTSSGEDYEGVLVALGGGTVASTDSFGFTLDNGLKIAISDAVFDYSAIIGETITSVTGVVRFDIFGGTGFEVLATNIVSGTRPTNTITELNDGTKERCPGDSRFNECIVVAEGIVTSQPVFINNNNAQRGALFGFYVADPANVDAEGRFQANSGVFVTVNPGNTLETVTLDGYTYDSAVRDWPTGPVVGDLVTITADNADRFGLPNLRNTTRIEKTGTDTLPLPALFGEGGHPLADLKGGRPDFAAGDFPGLEGIAASANVGQWEAVLVELKNVETTNACYAQPFAPATGTPFARDFGNFLVTGDIEIGDAFKLEQSFGGFFRNDDPNTIADTAKLCTNLANKCEDSRVAGQLFTSFVGIVDFNFNVNRVNPRTAADITGVSFVAPNTGNCPTN